MNTHDQDMRAERSESGFSLLEVLIAIFLFGLSMCGLAQLGYASMIGNKTSAMMSTATGLAQDRLEQVKMLGFDDADSAKTEEAYGAISGYEDYRRDTTVDSVGESTKEVVVTVWWGNDKHHFSMRTMISEQ
jgi:prepilin-type N-terminal cleavage/methylation domain-containing protein